MPRSGRRSQPSPIVRKAGLHRIVTPLAAVSVIAHVAPWTDSRAADAQFNDRLLAIGAWEIWIKIGHGPPFA